MINQDIPLSLRNPKADALKRVQFCLVTGSLSHTVEKITMRYGALHLSIKLLLAKVTEGND